MASRYFIAVILSAYPFHVFGVYGSYVGRYIFILIVAPDGGVNGQTASEIIIIVFVATVIMHIAHVNKSINILYKYIIVLCFVLNA